jgi:hypothetical protein
VAGDGVAFVLTAGDAACRAAGATLFPGVLLESLARDDLRPRAPFQGRLFGLLAAPARGAALGLVVPGWWAGEPGERPAPGDLVPIADHVGLEGCGPLTGRWPAVPRDFPSMTGVYQPSGVRSCHGARVYSSGVVAAGVADARRLTRFEALAVREGGWPIVSDSLVPVAIVAVYYGMRLAACALVQAPRSDRE